MNTSAVADSSASLEIRRAELRDVRSMRSIDRDVFRTPWTEGATITQVTAPGRVHFVVERSHRLIGHGGLVFLDDEAHVAMIAVDKQWWGQGVGDLLMGRLFEASKANGFSGLTLEVRESNTAAIGLYERHSLTVTGRRKRYYRDNGEDAIIMTGGGS